MNKSGTANYKGRRPVVIFPEGTKTNGHGVLEIEGDLLKMIDVASETLKIHSLRFDHEFMYFNPCNTTNYSGWKIFV